MSLRVKLEDARVIIIRKGLNGAKVSYVIPIQEDLDSVFCSLFFEGYPVIKNNDRFLLLISFSVENGVMIINHYQSLGSSLDYTDMDMKSGLLSESVGLIRNVGDTIFSGVESALHNLMVEIKNLKEKIGDL